MNLIFVKTFLVKSIYFTKKTKFTMAALGHNILDHSEAATEGVL